MCHRAVYSSVDSVHWWRPLELMSYQRSNIIFSFVQFYGLFTVNNAGIAQFDDAFFNRELDGDFAKPRAMMDINFWGAVRVMRAVLPSMKQQRSGRIVNMTSLSGLHGGPITSIAPSVCV